MKTSPNGIRAHGGGRWCKVHWATNFKEPDAIPRDHKVFRNVDWGWQNTQAKKLDGDNLMQKFGSLSKLREHLARELAL